MAEEEPPFIPTSSFDHQFEDLGRAEWQTGQMFTALGVTVAAIVIPPGSGLGPEAKPGLGFYFTVLGSPGPVEIPPIILPLDHRRKGRELAELVTKSAASAWKNVDELGVELRAEHRQDVKIAALGEVHCAICSTRIFGTVALRGACLACAPELPDADVRTVEPKARKKGRG